jgi:hypothetical protein
MARRASQYGDGSVQIDLPPVYVPLIKLETGVLGVPRFLDHF